MFYAFLQFLDFYRKAVTKYQLHSPLVFELVNDVLEDRRWFYAFRDVEAVRDKMLSSSARIEVTDFGAGAGNQAVVKRKTNVAALARRSGSSPDQGQMLFRLVEWAQPKTILELGTSVGISALYIASAARTARIVSLEGCAECAAVARVNLDILELRNVEVRSGEFSATLVPALETLGFADLVFVDGNHRSAPTLEYFETCLRYARDQTVFVFDDVHSSADMSGAWQKIRSHPRVTLTVDFFELSVVFINPDFREKQHFCAVSSRLKPWKVF
jgi:predicted O-methyltransferase YrrM